MFVCLNIPELERTDAKLVFPQYTSLEPKTVEDIRHVTAVEGTELTLLCRLNKDVATAQLVDAEGQAIALKPLEDGKHVYRATLTLSDPRRFQVQLVDREGRTNKLATEIVANVTRNRPAVVKMTQPAHDVAGFAARRAQAQGRARRRLRPGTSWPQLQHGGPRAPGDHPAGRRGQGPAVAPGAHARLRIAPCRARPASHVLISGPRTLARTASRGGHPVTCSSPKSGRSRRSSARANSPRADRLRTKSKRVNKAMPRRATSWRNCKRKSSTAPGN